LQISEVVSSRRSCRKFSGEPIEQEKIDQLLECANWAPSPANKQPWEFVVVRRQELIHQFKNSVDTTKEILAKRSGWKWVAAYKSDFLLQVPVLIVVVGDPAKNGLEQFLDAPSQGYQEACSAAVQNVLLAAESMGLASLWFSLFEKRDARRLFGIEDNKDPLAVLCIGYSDEVTVAPPRKDIAAKVRYLD